MNVLDKLQVIFDDHNEGVEDGHSSMDSVFELYGEICDLDKAKNTAYSERNKLVAALSKLFPSALSRHPEEDTSWEKDWMWIVFIDLPTGQITFHIHDSELGMFDHLPREQRVWDGHTTEEKYERLAMLPTQLRLSAMDVRDVEKENIALRNLVDGLERLLVGFRTQRTPSEATFKKIEKARKALKDIQP